METETATKERPILFSGPMVRAILSGQKTQTRRIVTARNFDVQAATHVEQIKTSGEPAFVFGHKTESGWSGEMLMAPCPHGSPGDRLWVRETARLIEDSDELDFAVNFADMEGFQKVRVRYEVDGTESDWLPYPSRLKPLRVGKCIPNGCYREAARIWLEITGVRVERLGDISRKDAQAEGIFLNKNDWWDAGNGLVGQSCPVVAFTHLWESINGPGSWAANPWVWVIEFKRLEAE